MKIGWVVGILLLTTPAIADDGRVTYYDAHGVPKGYSKQEGDRFVDYDSHGMVTGWQKVEGDRIVRYDRHGVVIGTIRR